MRWMRCQSIIGLAGFMAEVLIYSIRYIKTYNDLGVKRMRSGIFKLQVSQARGVGTPC